MDKQLKLLIAGVLSGVASAIVIDLQAFRSWKSFGDAYKYDWQLAAWRWFQGAVLGGLSVFGIGQVMP